MAKKNRKQWDGSDAGELTMMGIHSACYHRTSDGTISLDSDSDILRLASREAKELAAKLATVPPPERLQAAQDTFLGIFHYFISFLGQCFDDFGPDNFRI